MASGRLGAQDLSATTYTAVYTCPASTFTVASLSICNRSASTVTVRVAVTTVTPPSAPGGAEFIEYGASIVAGGVLERTGIVLDTGKILSVYSSAASVSAVAYGIETSTS